MMLPKGWKQATVSSVCDVVSVGIVVNPSQYYVDASLGVRAFRSQNVRENQVNDSNWAHISLLGHEKNRKSMLRAGDVVVVRTGFAGVACVVPPELDGVNCIDVLFARPRQTQVLPEYLSELTNSEFGRRQVLTGQTGLAQKHLNVSTYSLLNFPLPPISEQRQIVDILKTWNDAVSTVEALLANCRTQKLALMQRLLSGATATPSYSSTWRVHELGELFSERVENNLVDLPLLSITRDEGVIPRSEVGRKDTSNDDKSQYLRVCEGDIAYNTMRMWQGVSALSRHEGLVSPAYTVTTPNALIDGTFASYLFKHEPVVHLFYRHSQGLVSDTWNLKFPAFRKIRVAIPPLTEQRAIARVLTDADREVALHERALDALRNEKRALLADLLTGKRRVRISEDAAAQEPA